jgi:glycosyltransferase involved in cell wall biosynthesis
MQNVRVILNATDETVLAKMQTSFLLLHPSRREGYGISIVEAAANGVPALLIDYPDNASIDLGINPSLVSKSDSPEVISHFIEYAHENQKSLSQESCEWIRRAAVEQTMTRSAEQVNRMFQESVSVDKDRKDVKGS